jgi:hypothetical protein
MDPLPSNTKWNSTPGGPGKRTRHPSLSVQMANGLTWTDKFDRSLSSNIR